jgi:hypothetical protein
MARFAGVRRGDDSQYSVAPLLEPDYVRTIRELDRGFEDDPSAEEIEMKLSDADVAWQNPNDLETALHFASSHGHIRLVRAIVRRSLALGLSVDRTNVTGTAPLHYACMNGHEPVGVVLVLAGASIDLPTRTGIKPLAFAEFYFHQEMIQPLTRAAEERACREIEDAEQRRVAAVDAARVKRKAIMDGAATLRGQLRNFYAKHDPTKIESVGSVLTKYSGNEAKLYAELELKYGERP